MSSSTAVKKFIEYLRINTAHPTPDYAGAISFLKAYANEIGFDKCQEVEVHPEGGRKVLVFSYFGKNHEKPSILLNSHTDVVPVYREFWKCDPFEGKRYENGDIYGRGTQDMKSVGIQHMEVIRRLKENNIRPERTIHLTYVPDEEIGGGDGMNRFIKMKEFENLNVGLALDEGLASDTDEFSVFYSERLRWWVTINCPGNAGHGSRFIEKTAAEKLQRLINKVLAFREEEKQKLKSQCACLKLGDVTTVNLTILSGGIASNVVPSEFNATFDIRISPKMNIEDFKKKFDSWIAEAEGDDADSGRITCDFNQNKREEFSSTSLDDEKNVYWKSLKGTLNDLGLKYSTEVFPAATDSRYLRELGIPAFGFSPINNTPILLHDHNEFLNEKTFLRGIDILYECVLNLANIP